VSHTPTRRPLDRESKLCTTPDLNRSGCAHTSSCVLRTHAFVLNVTRISLSLLGFARHANEKDVYEACLSVPTRANVSNRLTTDSAHELVLTNRNSRIIKAVNFFLLRDRKSTRKTKGCSLSGGHASIAAQCTDTKLGCYVASSTRPKHLLARVNRAAAQFFFNLEQSVVLRGSFTARQ